MAARADGRDWVAVVLAVGIVVAFNSITVAILWDALHGEDPGISDNAVQILLTTFGGIIGVLGGYIGGRAVERAHRDAAEPVGNPASADRDDV